MMWVLVGVEKNCVTGMMPLVIRRLGRLVLVTSCAVASSVLACVCLWAWGAHTLGLRLTYPYPLSYTGRTRQPHAGSAWARS